MEVKSELPGRGLVLCPSASRFYRPLPRARGNFKYFWLGLGYSVLAEVNPGLVMLSITPFGQRGPKANWAATDLTVTAASGVLFITGDEDRAPVYVSIPQAYLNAGAEAAVGALIALSARERDGLGQHIDVSAQTAMMMTNGFVTMAHGWNDLPFERVGGGMKIGPLRLRFIYPCKDGHVNITFLFGSVLGMATRRLFEWIYDEGFCDEATRDKNWVAFAGLLMSGKEPLEELERCTGCIERFTLSHTKAELFEEATRRKVLLVPVSNIADLRGSEQLKEREFWTSVEHPELGRQITYPGPFAKLSRTPIRYRRRPPLLGEHAYEVLAELRTPPAQRNARREEAWPPALKGLKVLDFTWVYAGPASVRYLVDYGATVIHIESAKKIDTARTVGPYKDGRSGIERAAIYCNLHVGRYGLSLNLSTSKGRAVAMRLVKWADVVIENFSPKAMRSWGMDYESLRQIKPDLIMLSACLNGQTGPGALLAGYGTMGACMAGFGELTGWPDRAPAAPLVPIRTSRRPSSSRQLCWPHLTTNGVPARASTSTFRRSRRRFSCWRGQFSTTRSMGASKPGWVTHCGNTLRPASIRAPVETNGWHWRRRRMEPGRRCVIRRRVAGTKIHGSPAPSLGLRTAQRWTRL